MAKKETIYSFDDGSKAKYIRLGLKSMLARKYRTLFVNRLKFSGMDYEVPRFIMNKLFEGTQLTSLLLNTNEEVVNVGFTPYSPEGLNMYGYPVWIRPINQFNSPLIDTSRPLMNNIEASIIRPDFNYAEMVESYVNRIVDVEMTIRTNIKLHKMPFIVKSDEMKSAIEDVLDDKEVVAIAESAGTVQSAQTGTPFIIDKLQNYKLELENELLNLLGIKSIKHEKQAQMNVDETNMAEQEASVYQDLLFDKVKEWLNQTNEIFGTNFSVEINPVEELEEPIRDNTQEGEQDDTSN